MTINRTDHFKPALFAFSVFALLWSVLLLYAGGFTTSIEAGMAFLDWPLSNGSVNPDGWLEDKAMLAEHSHRLLGMKLGLLTIAIAVWTHLCEARQSVRWLAWILLTMVIFQGLLGGLRVLLDPMNTDARFTTITLAFLVAHACGAQIVVCLLTANALMQSRFWTQQSQTGPACLALKSGIISCCLIFLTIIAGALVRHMDAGLAVPYFPAATAEGALWPASYNLHSAVHMAHRALALAVTAAVLFFSAALYSQRQIAGIHPAWALLPLMTLAMQITLGALVVWTQINDYAATFHMLFGAVLLTTCWGLSLRVSRQATAQQKLTSTKPEPAGLSTASSHA